jgi:hypothetical protein
MIYYFNNWVDICRPIVNILTISAFTPIFSLYKEQYSVLKFLKGEVIFVGCGNAFVEICLFSGHPVEITTATHVVMIRCVV